MAANDDPQNELVLRTAEQFRLMVDSVGVKRFAKEIGLSTRQVNRILSGSQPNPLERVAVCLLASEPEAGDKALDFLCEEMGGYFVREETVDSAAQNAVKECAEAIAAISDGEISQMDEVEIREAVQALIGLARLVREQRLKQGGGPVKTPPM